jgi:hypothetical protein
MFPGLLEPGNRICSKQVAGAAFSMGKSIAILSPTDASVKDLCKAGFQARTFQGFQPRPERADVLVSSTMQVSVGDHIRITAGFREGKNVFKNNEIAQVREVTDTELVLHGGRRMRRNGARIDQGVCITSHASQCRTVDQVVVLPDGAEAKGWYVSLSRARDSMHVYTRDKAALRQSVMQPGERKSVWSLSKLCDGRSCNPEIE